MHARFHRPETGWDPVPSQHALTYGAQNQAANDALLEELEHAVGGFRGKRILDLGGGPGQYSVAFAKRGGEVTWHDISRNYRSIAQERANALGVSDRITFSLGYLDEAPTQLPDPYDFVFSRACWCYGFSDRSFAEVVYLLVRQGGYGYVDTNNSDRKRSELSTSSLFRTWLNDRFAVKIGHPFPPRGRAARLLLRFPLGRLVVDYASPVNDRLLFQKPGSGA